MDQTADSSVLPVDFEGSLDPSQLPEVTLGNHTLMATVDAMTPMVNRIGRDKVSPVRGRTMKEYDQQISDLKKENFSLKMRIYYMEERMQQRYGDGQDVFKTNIELQVEIDNLKKELMDKQVLVQKAALAMETLTAKHEQEEDQLKNRILADYKEEMELLRQQLNNANENCNRSYKDVEDAERKLEVLKKQLCDVRTELAETRKSNEVLSSKVKNTEFDVETLTGQLKLAEQARSKLEKENLMLSQRLKDFDDKLQDARRESVRKDRDITNLSAILQDQSHVDSTSILEPVHLQDELDDQKVTLAKKDDHITELERLLKDKDTCIEKLENAIEDLEVKKKDAEKALGDTEKEVGLKEKQLGRFKKSVEGLIKSVKQKEREFNEQNKKLEDALEEVNQLRTALKKMEIQKTEEVSNLGGQVMEAEANISRLRHQLIEANEITENLVKSLGKKEGELEGFQEQLSKAIDALTKSEDAVEALQTQLRAERAEFDNRIREQAVHFQVSVNNKMEANPELDGLRQQIMDLQKLIASQNVELLALARERYVVEDLHDKLKEKDKELELLSTEQKRELSEMERELQSLKAAINNKDLQIQALENHKVWLEDQQREAMKRMRETINGGVNGVNVLDLSLGLLQDIKMLMDLLRREISSLATLQLQLREFDKPEHGIYTELLTNEISSVQRIYRQLEEGVERNSQLHQALLNSLRGELRLSDSPDSNSCQDGGYNLGSAKQQSKQASVPSSPDMRLTESRPSKQQLDKPSRNAGHCDSLSSLESEWDSPPASQSVAVETCPELIDRSMQTGASFSHLDQWVQTSPKVGAADDGVVDWRERRELTAQDPHDSLPALARRGPSKLPYSCSDDDVRRHYLFGHHNDSLTDDAKEEHLGLLVDNLEDYHNFQHGVFFDEDHVDSNRGSSRKQISSQEKTIPSSHPKAGSVCGNNRSDNMGFGYTQRNKNYSIDFLADKMSDVSNADGLIFSGNTDGGCVKLISSSNKSANNNEGTDFDNENTNSQPIKKNESLKLANIEDSALSLGEDGGSGNSIKAVLLSKSKTASEGLKEKGHGNLGIEEQEPSDDEGENLANKERTEKKGGRDSKEESVSGMRSSWAEELQQYRVETESSQKDPQNPFIILENDGEHQLVATDMMSHSELKDLVTDLQIDLIHAVTNNQQLQMQLMTANSKLPGLGKMDDDDADINSPSHTTSISGYHTSHEQDQDHNRRSRIPRRLNNMSSHSVILGISSNITHDTTNTSEPQSSLSSVSESRHGREPSYSQLFKKCDNMTGGRKMTTSVVENLYERLGQSHNQVQELENKLMASRKLVQLLYSKNENYLSVLMAAGISVSRVGEMCHSLGSEATDDRALSDSNLSSLISGQDDGENETCISVFSNKDHNSTSSILHPRKVQSMERPRSHFPSTGSQSDNETCRSQLPSILEASSVTSAVSPDSTTRHTDCAAEAANSLTLLQERSNSNGPPDILLQCKDPVSSQLVTAKSPARSNTFLDKNIQPDNDIPARSLNQAGSHKEPSYPTNTNPLSNIHTDGSSTNSIYCPENTKQYNHQIVGTDDDMLPERRVSFGLGQIIRRLTIGGNVLDQSTFPQDVTYSSMMDNTMMSRLLTNLEHNMSTIREDALNTSSLSLEQLQVRVEHLERVNLTLREEIGVFEALQRSQGTQVSPPISEELGSEARGMTEDDLLKQHLIEIRKLRQRLEKLDVSKDPEQLLIFQSHTQQRIARQELMISHLQQEIVEKEEHWQRQSAELQHRLSREKTLLVEKLETTISELQKTINTQASKIREQDRQIADLVSELNLKHEQEQEKEEEIQKVIHEKKELETDLLKRDQEFLEIESKLFRIEMAKEKSEADIKRLSSEMEEKDRENETLKKQIEEFKESSRGLRETVIKCEKSIQEKIFTLQKVTNEKASINHKLVEKDGQVKKLEAKIGHMKGEINEMRMGLEEKAGLKAEIDRLREELKKKDNLEAKYEFQKVSYEAEIERITEEKIKFRAQLESRNDEKAELEFKVEELEHKLLGKAALESQVSLLKEQLKSLSELQDQVQRLNSELDTKTKLLSEQRDRLKTLSGLQDEVDILKSEVESKTKLVADLRNRVTNLSGLREEVDRLKSEADSKTKLTTELRERLKSLCNAQSEVGVLKAKLTSAEESARMAEEGKNNIKEDLKEREEKVKKRDKQLHHLIGQYNKLDAAFTKQKSSLTEKQELIESLKRQMRLYEVTLTSTSKEEKDNIMKQLLKELIATQRQVEDLLSRLEQNSTTLKPQSVQMEGFNINTSSTTISSTISKGSSHDDIPGIVLAAFGKDDLLAERSFNELVLSSIEVDQEPRLPTALTSISTNHLSPHKSALSSQSTSSNHSPRRLKYFVDCDYTAPKGNIPLAMIGSDIRSLFAVLKLDSHEKLRKETGECLVTLSGLEARLTSRLRMYKSKPVSESLEYSTLRESSMSCQNLRVCLEEVSRLLATAWITELPPVDSQGHFYDPVLVEQNENLKRELAELYSQMDHPLKEQQESSRHWETSLYNQLHKTTKDLEQAKENIDTSLADLSSPHRYQSLRLYSPHKSPRRYQPQTVQSPQITTQISASDCTVPTNHHADISLRLYSPHKSPRGYQSLRLYSPHKSPRRRLEDTL